MIALYILAALTLALCCAQPWLARVGERRLESERLRLQALCGQLRSELRAEVYFRRVDPPQGAGSAPASPFTSR